MMTVQTKIQAEPSLADLRKPFPDHQISQLPKPTKAQTDAVKEDYKAGIRCEICKQWHHPKVDHLDYVGHAALTDRLLDVDPCWSWEPVAFGPDGLPALDRIGGLWIKLTVLGVTRLGYGDADGKTGGNAIKEAIGDAIRNAGMRFGAALDLWHKGDLHLDETAEPEALSSMPDAEWSRLVQLIEATRADRGKMLKLYAVSDLRQLNQDQYAEVLGLLETKLAKLARAETDAKAAKANPRVDAELADEISY